VKRPDIAPKALTSQQAAQYLGVSRSHFFAHFRPMIQPMDMRRPGGSRPMWRWHQDDLDAFLNRRRTRVEEVA
jgi:predicted DNA-binding transcriptional regulator AlpA